MKLIDIQDTGNTVYAYFGHHKAASSWLLRVTKRYCFEKELRYGHFHRPGMFNYDLKDYVEKNRLEFIAYTNADIDFVNIPENSLKAFHVVRDPRDIIVSAYYSHKYSHSKEYWPELEQYRSRLKTLDHDEGIHYVMEYLPKMVIDGDPVFLFDQMMAWNYNAQNVYEIKFENLVGNPYFHLVQIFEFLGLIDSDKRLKRHPVILKLIDITKDLAEFAIRKTKIPLLIRNKKIKIEELLKIIYIHDFKNISRGRKRGEEDKRHHFRKGIPGDWRNHFNAEHKKYFKRKYNGLLIKLNYEKDDRW